MNELKQRLVKQFSIEPFVDYLLHTLIPNLFMVFVTLVAFYVGWKIIARALVVLRRSNLDETARAFVEQVIKYALATMAIVSALSQLGVNTASLLTSLGVAGLTLGFAARDTLSNVISGLFIFWDRPFVVGDLVEISDKYGRVVEITMRSTRVVTPDGRMLAIPNSEIINSVVASFTNFPHLRVDVEFTVGVMEDLSRVRRLALSILEGRDGVMSDPPPRVGVDELGDYYVKMVLEVWIEDERDHISQRYALREALFETLRTDEVDMPFETIQLAPVEVRTLENNKRS